MNTEDKTPVSTAADLRAKAANIIRQLPYSDDKNARDRERRQAAELIREADVLEGKVHVEVSSLVRATQAALFAKTSIQSSYTQMRDSGMTARVAGLVMGTYKIKSDSEREALELAYQADLAGRASARTTGGNFGTPALLRTQATRSAS